VINSGEGKGNVSAGSIGKQQVMRVSKGEKKAKNKVKKGAS
jgi:hypothetical protein